jgi:hypothetical protein
MRGAFLPVGLLVAFLASGCDWNDRALFSTPHDFPDKKYAGVTVFIHDSSRRQRAEELRAEIVQLESEMFDRMKSPDFNRQPIERRMDYVNSVRRENFVLMTELRNIIDANR